MKLRLFSACFSFVTLFVTLFGEVIETHSIIELPAHLTPETLLIFDIDNTLIEPKQTLGSDQWFYYRIDQCKKDGLSEKKALFQALSEWIALQHMTDVKPVEEEIPCFVNLIQKEGFCAMGLTTRGLEMSFITPLQLKKVGIDLTLTAPEKNDIFFMNERGVLYHEGILFTSATSKGEALFKFLDKINYKADRILFINDKESHLRDVEQSCIIRNIPFIGLRYSYTDEKVSRQIDEIVDNQLDTFRKILSDKEATKKLD